MSTIETVGQPSAPPAPPAPAPAPAHAATAPTPEGARVMVFLAILVGVAFVGLVYLLIFFPPDETKTVTLLTAMTGVLAGAFTTIIGFFFGNSRSSAPPNGGSSQ